MIPLIAALAAGTAVWLWSGRSLHAASRVREPPLADNRQSDRRRSDCRQSPRHSLLHCGHGAAAADTSAADTMLVLEMLRVTVLQGASLSHACTEVGTVTAGVLGAALAHVGHALDQGIPWREAWSGAQAGNISESTTQALTLMEHTLAPSWEHGASPVQPLASAIERLDQDERAAIEQTAGKLTVRLLLPTGLCFLPAFMFIGVIPAIASFTWQF